MMVTSQVIAAASQTADAVLIISGTAMVWSLAIVASGGAAGFTSDRAPRDSTARAGRSSSIAANALFAGDQARHRHHRGRPLVPPDPPVMLRRL